MTSAEPTPDQLRRDPLPLRGRVAVVTGVSRPAGIGYAIARRLAAQGASLVLHHYAPHDRDQPWGADPGGPEAVIAGVTAVLADPEATVRHQEADLSDPDAPARLIEAAAATSRFLDILVCNHARSVGDGPLGTLTAGMLDAHWAANTASITRTLADHLAGQSITLNTVNPGPVDTGYAPPEAHEIVRRHFPQGRWGTPDDPARLIAWQLPHCHDT